MKLLHNDKKYNNFKIYYIKASTLKVAQTHLIKKLKPTILITFITN